MTARGAAAWQRHDHAFGSVVERDRHSNLFGEVAVRGSAGPATWVAGAAYERDAYRPRDVPRFAYIFDVPGLFAQVDVQAASRLAVSAGTRGKYRVKEVSVGGMGMSAWALPPRVGSVLLRKSR